MDHHHSEFSSFGSRPTLDLLICLPGVFQQASLLAPVLLLFLSPTILIGILGWGNLSTFERAKPPALIVHLSHLGDVGICARIALR